mmetsp:Transcript_686/g.1862  ORF Transcript_686/g.1862 Transcript_686/m.1862 type:complete len:250 (+) Transcript_686:518-1267(+)
MVLEWEETLQMIFYTSTSVQSASWFEPMRLSRTTTTSLPLSPEHLSCWGGGQRKASWGADFKHRLAPFTYAGRPCMSRREARAALSQPLASRVWVPSLHSPNPRASKRGCWAAHLAAHELSVLVRPCRLPPSHQSCRLEGFILGPSYCPSCSLSAMAPLLPPLKSRLGSCSTRGRRGQSLHEHGTLCRECAGLRSRVCPDYSQGDDACSRLLHSPSRRHPAQMLPERAERHSCQWCHLARIQTGRRSMF